MVATPVVSRVANPGRIRVWNPFRGGNATDHRRNREPSRGAPFERVSPRADPGGTRARGQGSAWWARARRASRGAGGRGRSGPAGRSPARTHGRSERTGHDVFRRRARSRGVRDAHVRGAAARRRCRCPATRHPSLRGGGGAGPGDPCTGSPSGLAVTGECARCRGRARGRGGGRVPLLRRGHPEPAGGRGATWRSRARPCGGGGGIRFLGALH